jgi:uncharacterized membrane protein YccC
VSGAQIFWGVVALVCALWLIPLWQDVLNERAARRARRRRK